MEKVWLDKECEHEQLILAGDVGGTNASLALVARKGRDFTLMLKCHVPSAEVSEMVTPLKAVLAEIEAEKPGLKPSLCCLSIAGPVEDNVCTPTNLPWIIDGNAIEKELGIPTRIINDFMAISYSLPLLDVDNPEQITKLPHPGGACPEQDGVMRAVVGAGTGLGVGFLAEVDGRFIAYPSEGGHVSFPGFDEETRDFEAYMVGRDGPLLDVELLVSGQGITNIFHYFKDHRKVEMDAVLTEIAKADDSDKPPMISKHAESHEVCADVIRLFVKLYGRFSGDMAIAFMCEQGLYLAGGIASKNERFFLENDLFMKHFEATYNPNINRVLKSIPVFIVKDYAVSLYGAANAAVSLMGAGKLILSHIL